jgi:hypothetical protein
VETVEQGFIGNDAMRRAECTANVRQSIAESVLQQLEVNKSTEVPAPALRRNIEIQRWAEQREQDAVQECTFKPDLSRSSKSYRPAARPCSQPAVQQAPSVPRADGDLHTNRTSTTNSTPRRRLKEGAAGTDNAFAAWRLDAATTELVKFAASLRQGPPPQQSKERTSMIKMPRG